MRMMTGTLHADFFRRLNHAVGQTVTAKDAAEDIDEDRFDIGIALKNTEAVFDLLGTGAAAHVEEVDGVAAGVLDTVHGGHGQAGAVDHVADVPAFAQMDIVQGMASEPLLPWDLLRPDRGIR
jgi:hypothetical protein